MFGTSLSPPMEPSSCKNTTEASRTFTCQEEVTDEERIKT